MSVKHLYQQTILDHNKNPRNFKEISNPSYCSHGKNPLCGDDYFVFFNVDSAGLVSDIGFKGTGCAISKSSASLMTTMVKGKPIDDVKQMVEAFIRMLTRDTLSKEDAAILGKLVVFEGVKQYPVRVKCATLIWRAIEGALESEKAIDVISTE